jgi:glycosyltransferase involved in cell wall biosynthesis
MKILITIPALGTVYGGPSKSVIELAQALGNQNIDVDIVSTSANGSEAWEVPHFVWLNQSGYRIQYFPYWRTGDYKFSLSLTQWLFQHVAEYDLVHTNAIFSYPILATHWACSFHKVPYIMTPHGMLDPWALAYKATKKRLYFSFLEKSALQRASALQVLTASEMDQVAKLGLRVPLYLIPNGIQQQEFRGLHDSELFYQKFSHTRNKTLILFLGRIDPKKGLDLLATAFADVQSRFPDTHLIIAGPNNIGFLPTAQQYFAEAGCLDAVTFTGMLTGPIKYAALAAAYCYVAPSYSEGFSISVLEGMASGLPCVITSACNFPEAAVAQAAYVVDIDATEIANALIDCLSQPQKAKEMGDRAQKFIFQNYTWNRIATKLSEIYAHIISKNIISSSELISVKQ